MGLLEASRSRACKLARYWRSASGGHDGSVAGERERETERETHGGRLSPQKKNRESKKDLDTPRSELPRRAGLSAQRPDTVCGIFFAGFCTVEPDRDEAV